MPQLSFRRTSGLVLTGNPEVMLKMDFQRRYPEVGLGEIAVISSKPVSGPCDEMLEVPVKFHLNASAGTKLT